MKKSLAGLLLAAYFCVLGQSQDMNVVYNNAGGKAQYICTSAQTATTGNDGHTAITTVYAKADSSLTSIGVATNVATATTASAHQMYFGYRFVVAGSTTSALNGTYVVTDVPSATTFKFVTAGVGDATYSTSLLTISTTNPLLNAPLWSITVLVYDTGGAFVAQNQAGPGVSTARSAKCSDRTLY